MNKQKAIMKQLLKERKAKIDMALKILEQQGKISFYLLPYDLERAMKSHDINFLKEEEKQDNLFEFEKLVCNMSHEELTKALEIILKEIRLSETAIKEGYEK